MQDELSKRKEAYAHQIEDGRKIEVFTSMPEWQWYVESVIKPTIEEYTHRIMTGEIQTDKEDWITRGMVQGMRMIIETTTAFKDNAEVARKKAKELQDAINEGL